MQQFSHNEIAELRSRIDQIQGLLAGRGDAMETLMDDTGPLVANDGSGRSLLADHVSFSIQLRRIRKSHFGAADISGPIWDMMLDLMLAESHGRQLSASDLATGAAVPLSSGLRMIAALEGMGLAQRSIDERDRRRTIVRLTEQGSQRMTGYFEKVGAALRTRRHLAA